VVVASILDRGTVGRLCIDKYGRSSARRQSLDGMGVATSWVGSGCWSESDHSIGGHSCLQVLSSPKESVDWDAKGIPR